MSISICSAAVDGAQQLVIDSIVTHFFSHCCKYIYVNIHVLEQQLVAGEF